jgi:phage terminase large subunit
MKFYLTTATKKVSGMRKRIRAVQGGTSASKTISIIAYLVSKAIVDKTPTVTSIVSESFPHLRRGAIKDFLSMMKEQNAFKENQWNKTNFTYTFDSGSIIEFFSADQSDKVRGPRRDRLFINECNNISFEAFDQLEIRTKEFIFLDWNPISDFWYYDKVAHRKDCEHTILTYKDNEALSKEIISSIEQHKDQKEWWKVYGLGLLGETESRIYTGWEIIDSLPAEAKLKVKGLDFGYTNDPTAIVDVYEYDNGYVLDEVIFETGLKNNQIAKIIGKDTVITIADSAEPKSIAEIAQHGITIIGSKKGKGSVSHGIDSVQSKKIRVTKRSLNIIKEYRNYIFITDDEGKITNEPRDLFNHSMDAIRYAIAFLNPVVEDEETYVPEVAYETPGIRSSKAADSVAIKPTIRGPSKNRMAFILERKKLQKENSFETDTPYQTPGLQK